jgi:hypothetical protein
MLSSFIFKFILKKLKVCVAVYLLIGLLLYIAFGSKLFLEYSLGFVVGFANFALLSIGSDIILTIKPKRVRIMHFLFFTLRYLLIAYIIIQPVKYNNANIFALVGGLLTTNLSIALSVFRKHA